MAITGFQFPLELDAAGTLKLASGADYVKCLIHSFLLTYKGERMGLLDYGLDVYLFTTYQNFGFIAQDLERKLTESIPQAEFACRATLNQLGEGYIEVYWKYLDQEQETIRFSVGS